MKWYLSFIFFCMLLLNACMLKPVKTEYPARYVLKGVSEKRYATVPTHMILLVSQPDANPGYQSDALVYVNKPYQLNNFGQSAWVAPPSQLILPLLVESLRNTHYFHAVMSPPFTGLADFRLETQLITLQQEFFPRKSNVRMEIQATLIDNKNNQILASRHFKQVVLSPTLDPYGGVTAANKATENLLKQITEFVIHTVKH